MLIRIIIGSFTQTVISKKHFISVSHSCHSTIKTIYYVLAYLVPNFELPYLDHLLRSHSSVNHLKNSLEKQTTSFEEPPILLLHL